MQKCFATTEWRVNLNSRSYYSIVLFVVLLPAFLTFGSLQTSAAEMSHWQQAARNMIYILYYRMY